MNELKAYIKHLRAQIKALKADRQLMRAGLLEVKLAEAQRTLKAVKEFSPAPTTEQR